MKLIEWKDEYDLEIAEIDDQHRHLCNLINILIHAQNLNKGNDVLKDTIVELVNYTQTHFKDEEAHMLRNSYPNYKKHQKMHQMMIDQIIAFLQSYKAGKTLTPDQILDFMLNWFLKHVTRQDKEYGQFLKEKA